MSQFEPGFVSVNAPYEPINAKVPTYVCSDAGPNLVEQTSEKRPAASGGLRALAARIEDQSLWQRRTELRVSAEFGEQLVRIL